MPLEIKVNMENQENGSFKLKKDRYRNVRGGEAHLLDIRCVKCNSLIITYQKDGIGGLLRCYLNRIMYPPELERLQYHFNRNNLKSLPNLTCKSCGLLIGTPMLYMDGRVAYRLQRGNFLKRRIF